LYVNCADVKAVKAIVEKFEDYFWELSEYFDKLSETSEDLPEDESMERLKQYQSVSLISRVIDVAETEDTNEFNLIKTYYREFYEFIING
jgi:hypothetical protein